ncbi:MAG: hypothetical protein B6D58_08355 [candidate division Zixibacteria bacterium 4484_95]|nr:MAG: hypothetical protein B6D58_08355 [candidate division Zixibacteria bacterium 4484_95]
MNINSMIVFTRWNVSLATIIFILLFSFMTSWVVADEITPPVFVTSSSTNEATLGIPRWKGYVSESASDNFWLCYANSSTNAGNINYTTDGGNSWSSHIIQVDNNGFLDFHVSLFGQDGELYFTWPSSSIMFRKFNAPAHSNDDRGPLRNISGTTASHRSNIMVQDNGRVWVFTRKSNDAVQNVLYHYSDNEGVSWTSGVAHNTGAPNVRIGSMPYVNGNPALVVLYLNDNRGYEYYLWNGNSFEVKDDHSIYQANMGEVRVFTHNVINDTTMHLIFGLGDALHHLWKHYNNGTGSWNHQIIETSSHTFNNDWFPISTVKGDNLYLFYCKKSSSSFSSSMIYYKKWSQSGQSWTEPVLISTDPANTHNRDPNTSFQIPTQANYIPVFWHCGSNPNNQSIYFAKIITDEECYILTVEVVGSGIVEISPEDSCYNYGEDITLTAVPNSGWEFAGWSGGIIGNPATLSIVSDTMITATFIPEEEDTIPPGDIMDLGTIIGENHGQIDLSWTAPGDNGNAGTASYYVIKYSVEIIDDLNWQSATTFPNPPVPSPAGNIETCTIGGLVEGQIYYIAIKTYDEVDNGSGLSNVPDCFARGVLIPQPVNTYVDSMNNSVTVTSLAVDSYIPIFYEFALDTLLSFTSPRIEIGFLSDTTVSAVFDQLINDVIYFWRCRAVASDESDSSSWSEAIDFNLPPVNIVDDNKNKLNLPQRSQLEGNYPNPFNSTTCIRYYIVKNGRVRLTIFDVLGRTITTLVDMFHSKGSSTAIWKAENYPSGIYYYKLDTSDVSQIGRMTLLR